MNNEICLFKLISWDNMFLRNSKKKTTHTQNFVKHSSMIFFTFKIQNKMYCIGQNNCGEFGVSDDTDLNSVVCVGFLYICIYILFVYSLKKKNQNKMNQINLNQYNHLNTNYLNHYKINLYHFHHR